MTFRSHLEYINHITCSDCKHYWTHSTMDPNFQISSGEWFCPNCESGGKVTSEDYRISIQEENSLFSPVDTDPETSTNWFPESPPRVPPRLKEVDLCLCEDSPEGKVCECDAYD